MYKVCISGHSWHVKYVLPCAFKRFFLTVQYVVCIVGLIVSDIYLCRGYVFPDRVPRFRDLECNIVSLSSKDELSTAAGLHFCAPRIHTYTRFGILDTCER